MIQTRVTTFGVPPSRPYYYLPDYPLVDVPCWDPPLEPFQTVPVSALYTGLFDQEAGPSGPSQPMVVPPPPFEAPLPQPPPPPPSPLFGVQALVTADPDLYNSIHRVPRTSTELLTTPIYFISESKEDPEEHRSSDSVGRGSSAEAEEDSDGSSVSGAV